MESTKFNPVKVTITLKDEQYTEPEKRWKCFAHGKYYFVDNKTVEWYCFDLDDALYSFKQDEVESFILNGIPFLKTVSIPSSKKSGTRRGGLKIK